MMRINKGLRALVIVLVAVFVFSLEVVRPTAEAQTSINLPVVLEGHVGEVTSVVWSPDGTQLASGGSDGTVHLWDAASGEHLAAWKAHSYGAVSVAWSPDGTRLATGGIEDEDVRIWDVAKPGVQLTALTDRSRWRGISQVFWSPDSTHVVTLDYRDYMNVWNVAQGVREYEWQYCENMGDVSWWEEGPRVICWDGNDWVYGDTSNWLSLWDSIGFVQVDCCVSGIDRVAWASGGVNVAIRVDECIYVWDVIDGRELAVLECPSGELYGGMAWSPDGAYLASGGVGAVHLWDTSTWEPSTIPIGYVGRANALAWSPDSARLALGTQDGVVLLWNVGSNLCTAVVNTNANLRFGPGGDYAKMDSIGGGTRVVAAGQDAAGEWVQLWHRNLSGIPRPWIAASLLDALTCPDGVALPVITDVEAAWTVTPVTPVQVAQAVTAAPTVTPTPTPVATRTPTAIPAQTATPTPTAAAPSLALPAVIDSFDEEVEWVSWSPDGSRLAGVVWDEHDTVYIWDAATGRRLAALNPGAQATAMKWSPDGTRLAVGGNVIFDDAVFVWDTSSGEQLGVLTEDLFWGGYYNPVTWTLAFSDHEGGESAWAASGHRAVFAYAEGFDLVVWDVATGDKLAVLKGHTDAFWSSAWWSPDGTRLASAGTDDKVFIWDVVSGAQLAVFDCDWGFCERSLAWSPDGTRLAGVGSVDGRIMVRIWSTISGEQLNEFEVQLNDGGWVAWLPDGERLATGGYYRSLRFWDAVSGQLLIEFEGNDAMWSPDGMRVAGGFRDMIYVWDALTGERLATLVGHTSWVNSIDWSPDGEYLVSGGDDGTVRLWRVTDMSCTATTNAASGANLRDAPDADNSYIRGAAVEGEELLLIGQNADGSWYQVWHENANPYPSYERLWIAGFLTDDLTCPEGFTLPIVE